MASDPGDIARVNAAFTEFAGAHAVPASIRRSLNVALDELLQNTLAHGFGEWKVGAVTIEVELGTDRLTVTLSDDGQPFNPLDVASPDTASSLEDRPVGGLGIHLVRQLMDEIRYRRQSDRNVVTLVKRLTSGSSEA
jgi:anti-sigma regulatory factor (Ser/Thr protein kinase)